ncbi:cuticle protein CP14.6-like [Scylla paramamosain]|uniref:cuticle protein CP14.6-like n=1 Tax=Scylla paramamosain TaxID=85552 RepID=UPI0030834B29
MKLIILATALALAAAAPTPDQDREVVPIVKYDRIQEDDGRYSVDVETGNGIRWSQSGSPVDNGAIATAGQYSYTAPDGILVEMKFVADENGFQPESPFLPVAPEFPHPIPQFVLDQIEFAAKEDAELNRQS